MSHAELMTPENQKPEADKSKRQSALAPAGLLGRAVIVAIILREKNNFWWAWDSIKECICAIAKLIVAIIWVIGAPFTMPVMVILDWRRIDKAAVNRFWDKWFKGKRPNIRS